MSSCICISWESITNWYLNKFYFYVHCSDVIAFEVELDEGHVDHWLVLIKQIIDTIIAHLLILHVFFEGSKGNTLLELLLESLNWVDILGFNYTYYAIYF